MKKMAALLVPAVLSLFVLGCDEAALSDSAKSLLTSQPAAGVFDQIQSQIRLQLHDGSCTGDGNAYGGGNGQGGSGSGNGVGDRDRLRNGSCNG